MALTLCDCDCLNLDIFPPDMAQFFILFGHLEHLPYPMSKLASELWATSASYSTCQNPSLAQLMITGTCLAHIALTSVVTHKSNPG